MTLEFEKLTTSVEQMGQYARQYQLQHATQLQAAQQKLDEFAQSWQTIERCLDILADHSPAVRIARPFSDTAPLNKGIPLPSCPETATIFATDGSQIMPDRHAPFLYYLINVGGLVFHHGSNQPPDEVNRPLLKFREDDILSNRQVVSGAEVSARRDLEEIETLAQMVFERRELAEPLLAILDQRLLYYPFLPQTADPTERTKIVKGWQTAMQKIHFSGALMVGYIDGSRRNWVVRLLSLLDKEAIDYEGLMAGQAEWDDLTDLDIYKDVLKPGERSPTFLYVTDDNKRYADVDEAIEVGFFYLNVANYGSHLARVDVPRWVMEDEGAMDKVHALLYDQCQILGDYPYVLTRADEIAVVGRGDAAELNNWIELQMQREGIYSSSTAKQSTKDMARASKTQHGMY
jgi:hypothetical protein